MRSNSYVTFHGLVACCLAILSGCQVLDSSVEYETRADGSLVRKCESSLGSYALPYSTITVKVIQPYQGSNPVKRPRLLVEAPKPRPDPRHMYCLDFLENPLSEDVVQVYYAGAGSADEPVTPASLTPNGMLSLIVSKNADRTAEVARNLIRAIFVLVSRNADFNFGRLSPGEPDRNVMMTDQSVDPFSATSMASLNRSLREYGYCITLGKYTFDTNRLTDQDYCNKPELSLSDEGSSRFLRAAASQQYLTQRLPVGIFYRPRQPYQLFIYVRDDPEIGGPWELRKIDTVMLENISPILVLKVSRTIFAERRTALAFDNGNLLDVCIGKGSEVLGGLNIPLDIVYGLVSLPSEAIRAEIALKRTSSEVLQKQKELIDLQNTLLAAKADEFPGASPNAQGVALGATDDLAFKTKSFTPITDGNITQTADLANLCKLLN